MGHIEAIPLNVHICIHNVKETTMSPGDLTPVHQVLQTEALDGESLILQ